MSDSLPVSESTSLKDFTVQDWIGTLTTGSLIVLLFFFPIRSFASMFEDFGGVEQLPAFTRTFLVIPWLPPVLAIALGSLAGSAFRPGVRLYRRRALVTSTFVL